MKLITNKKYYLSLFLIMILIKESQTEIFYTIKNHYSYAESIVKREYLNTVENDEQLTFYLANLYYINGKIKEAKHLYKQIKDNTYLENNIKNLSLFMYAECCAILGEYDEAIKNYDKLFATSKVLDLLLPYVYYGKIFCLYKKKEFNSTLLSISLFNQYIRSNKLTNLPLEIIQQIDFFNADSWYSKGDYRKSKQLLNDFISKYENSDLTPYVTFKLSTIYENDSKYVEAEKLLSDTIKKYQPEEIKNILEYNLARIKIKQNKHEDAIKDLEKLLISIKDNSIRQYLHLELAYCYFATNNYLKAINELNKIDTTIQEINMNKMFLLGQCFFANKNYDKSINAFNMFLRTYYTDVKWYDDCIYWLGVCYYKNSQFDKAIKTFSLLRNKKSSSYYIVSNIYIAKCYSQIKEFELAKLSLNKLLEQKERLDSSIINTIYFELAETYKFSYDFQNAIQYYNKVIDNNTVNDISLIIYSKFSLAEIYNSLKNYEYADRILYELMTKQNLSEEFTEKIKLLYITVKYNLSDFLKAEKICIELLSSKDLEIEEQKYVINLLLRIYTKNQNYTKVVEFLEKLLAITKYPQEKFSITLKIFRTLYLIGDYENIYKRATELLKKEKVKENIAILNYFLLTYHFNRRSDVETINLLYNFDKYLPEYYKHFNYTEIANLVSISKQKVPEIAINMCEKVIPILNIDVIQKTSIIKDTIEHLISQNQLSKVIKLASILKTLSLDPYISGYSEFIIGRTYELGGKTDMAESVYKNIIEKYPNLEYIPRIIISLININRNKNEEISKFYEEYLIDRYPHAKETVEYIYQKAKNYFESKNYEETLSLLKLITDLKDNNISVYAQKLVADCYFNMGKYKEASVEYLRILYLYPDITEVCAEAQFMIGVCAEKLNLYNEAKKAYINSKQKYPGTLWAQESEVKLKKMR
ncbi:MAG: tetratricopeptide repeat protein [Endomicrobia bacterium]|nr:tetratricopeptide repeat protein [Endomicrobiia bacterium]